MMGISWDFPQNKNDTGRSWQPRTPGPCQVAFFPTSTLIPETKFTTPRRYICEKHISLPLWENGSFIEDWPINIVDVPKLNYQRVPHVNVFTDLGIYLLYNVV